MRRLLFALATCLLVLPAQAQYSGGSGTADDPYQIATAADLIALGETPDDYDKHFILTADIDLDPNLPERKVFDRAVISPIECDIAFTGVFNGDGHTLSNFSCSSTDANSIALYGWVQGQIINLGLVNPQVRAYGRDGVAPLVDTLDGGTVSGCFVQGGSASGGQWVGGLVACNLGTIVNCYSLAAITGNRSVGGLVGSCYDGTIRNSYSAGWVTGVEDVGGLVGAVEDSFIAGCYWDVEESGQFLSAAGVGKTTSQLQSGLTFINWWTDATWTIDEGNDYPRLAWEGAPGAVLLPPAPPTLPSCVEGVAQFEAAPSYAGGTGEPNNPFLIATPEQLHRLGSELNDWDKHFRLTADIDLECTGMIIGDFHDRPFTGVFDGNGHNIANFQLMREGVIAGGLFGYVRDPNARIVNLTLIDPLVRIVDGEAVGALVGSLSQGTVEGCQAEGGLVDVDTDAGGLVGSNHSHGMVRRCYASLTVTGADRVGGLIGNNWGNVIQCLSDGEVIGSHDVGGLVGHNVGDVTDCYSLAGVRGLFSVGGLIGSNTREYMIGAGRVSLCYSAGVVHGDLNIGGLVGRNSEIVIQCFSDGEVIGSDNVGGLVGYNVGEVTDCYSLAGVRGLFSVGGLVGSCPFAFPDTWPRMFRCYSAGVVSGKLDVGGLVGVSNSFVTDLFLDCFWDNEISGLMTSAAGIGRTTAEMQSAMTFEQAGWGCNPVWTIDEGQDYPRLTWEDVLGQPIDKSLSAVLAGEGTEASPYLVYTLEDALIVAGFPCEQDSHYRLMFLEGDGSAESPYLIYDANDIEILHVFPLQQDMSFRLAFVEGEGTQASPYVIDSVEDLDLIIRCPYEQNAHYRLGFLAGEGTAESPYLIYTADELNLVGMCPYERDGHFKLVVDIDMSGITWSDAVIPDFAGVFDGNGHIISHLTIRGESHLGLFGRLADGAEVKDLSVVDVNVIGSDYSIGGLVGGNSEGTITACYCTGTVTGDRGVGGVVGSNSGTIVATYSCCTVNGNDRVGGLSGSNWGDITMSYSTGTAKGNVSVGGLVGSGRGTIAHCYAIASVFGYTNIAVGLIGLNEGVLTDCYARSEVFGDLRVGGLVGMNESVVTRCYCTGRTSGNQLVGGLVGSNLMSTSEQIEITLSFWDSQSSGLLNMCGGGQCDDAARRTTAGMQTAATFLEAGWDFMDETENGTDDIWWILEGQDYPRLSWELEDEVMAE